MTKLEQLKVKEMGEDILIPTGVVGRTVDFLGRALDGEKIEAGKGYGLLGGLSRPHFQRDVTQR